MKGRNAVEGIKLPQLIKRDLGFDIGFDVEIQFTQVDVDALDDTIEQIL
jgi:hypothetical protein